MRVWTTGLTGEERIAVDAILDACVLADRSKMVVVAARGGPWAVRFSPSGAVLSSVPLPGFGGDETSGNGLWAAADPLGRVYVMASGPRVMAFDGRTASPLWQTEFQPAGLKSSPFFGGTGWLALTADGDPIVADSCTDASRTYQLVLFRLDRLTGRVVWGPVPIPLESSNYRTFPRARSLSDGIFVGVGRAHCDLWNGCFESGDAVLARLDPRSGAILWETTAGASPVTGLEVSSRGRILLVTGVGVEARRASDGSLLWRRDELTQNPGSQMPLATFDPEGHVVAVLPATPTSSALVKLEGSTGGTAWGPAPIPDRTSALSVDGEGSPLLTSWDPVGLRLEKREAGSGRQLWSALLPGVFGLDAGKWRRAVLVTPDGDPFVAATGPLSRSLVGQQVEGDDGHADVGPSSALDRGLRSSSGSLGLPSTWGGDALVGVLDAVALQHPLSRLDRASGREVWRASVLGSARAAADGGVFVLGWETPYRYRLSRLDPQTGVETFRVPSSWSLDSLGLRMGLPGDDTVRVVARAVTVGAGGSVSRGAWRADVLNASGGELLRQGQLVGAAISELEPRSGDVVTLEGGVVDAGFVLREDTGGGGFRWRVPAPFSPVLEASFTPDGEVLLRGSSFQACLLDGIDGRILFGPTGFPPGALTSFDTEGGLAIGESTVVDGSPRLRVSRLDRRTGVVRWSRDLSGLTGSRIEAAPTAILVAGTSCEPAPCRDVLYALGTSDGASMWDVPLPPAGRSRALAIDGHGLVTTSWAAGGVSVSSFAPGLGFERQGSPPPVGCGIPFSFAPGVRNGRPPLSFHLESGALPEGISLDAETGALAGTAAGEPGDFLFRLSVTDATGARAEAGFGLTALPGPWALVAVDDLAGGAHRLTAPALGTDVRWMPGGETTRSILVSPRHPAVYGVSVRTADGCRSEGARGVRAERPDVPGDLDANDVVNVFDLVIHASLLVGNVTPGVSPYLASREAADLDGNGAADVLDLVLLATRLVEGPASTRGAP